MTKENLKAKLVKLPAASGVYFHKDKTGQIIYVGKAAVLKNRVRQYFQNINDKDIKTRALVDEIVDVDWIETDSEIDALFLEAEMVKRYMPKYNILLRDDKSLLFVRIDTKSEWPTVSYTRNPIDDGAEYFGPYYNGFAIKKALRYLRRVFPYYIKSVNFKAGEQRLDLDAHLGLSPVGMTSEEYRINIKKLISYIKGNRKLLINDLKNEMTQAAKDHKFEIASHYRNKLFNLQELQKRIMFGDKEFLDISKDVALKDLTDMLRLPKIPARIEGYDISHMSGTNVVASMVVFKNGVSDRSEYRKFKTRIEHNNDFFNMRETITRRLSNKNLTGWGRPDLVLIDGGKGQLDAAIKARDELGLEIPFIGLAKRQEEVIVKDFTADKKKIQELGGNIMFTDDYATINLPNNTHVVKLLQRIRDESHRFAVSYHTVLKLNKQTTSLLDGIPGVGPKTRQKLIRKFGSLSAVKRAKEQDIIKLIGIKKTKIILSLLNKS